MYLVTDHLSGNHRRNIAKALSAGLTIESSRAKDDYETHVLLMQSSTSRRQRRGEDIAMPHYQEFDHALLQGGIGTIYQAKLGSETMASVLVLKSSSSAYYQSAGTLPAGMQIGASPFLIHEVAKRLKKEGYRSFNLGGADTDAPGLRRFKKGFGAKEIDLFAADYTMSSRWNRAIGDIIKSMKRFLSGIINVL
jgi:lipid II:glycine glycyltransferase (peptidoglycan interpeptide bridge formation enzyme)